MKKRSKARRRRSPAPARRSKPSRRTMGATPVTAAELRALRRELDRKMKPMRWNPEPEEVQRSVVRLVLTVVEFLRQLMERQTIRRMENRTLTRREVETVGRGLMQLEDTIRDIGARFGLSPDELNVDLGPLGKLL